MVQDILTLCLVVIFLVAFVSEMSQPTDYHRLEPRAPKNRVAVSLWRFAKRFPMAADSIILELQEAQILFTGTVYIATYITFTNYTNLTENTLSLSAYAYNVFIIEAILLSDCGPLLRYRRSSTARGTDPDTLCYFSLSTWLSMRPFLSTRAIKPMRRWSAFKAFQQYLLAATN